MQYLKLLLVSSLCVGALSQALADEPPPAAAPATPASSAPAPLSTAAASPVKPEDATSAASAAKPDDAAAAANLAAQTKRLRSAGYKPETHNGVTLFCRSEKKMGSFFETKTCSDGDSIEKAAQEAKDSVQKFQRQNPLRAS
jgi:hypothetical protein